MVDFLARCCLWFTQESFLIPFIIIGYFAFSKNIFRKALFILCFSMALNAYLKSLWQIPLSPALGKEGWAFPSGHMQAAVVFWGWLAWEFKQVWLTAFVLLLLAGIGVSLVHFGYHDSHDIFGAWGFGVLSLIAYGMLLRRFEGNLLLVGLLLFILALPMIYLIPQSLPHLWIAEGALLGFSLGCFLSQSELRHNVLWEIIVALLGAALIYVLCNFLKPFYDLRLINFVQFFLIGLWVSFGTEKVTNRIQE